MEFPGDNEVRLSNESVRAIFEAHIKLMFGDHVRVQRVTKTSSYTSDMAATVDFTTDPKPAPREEPPNTITAAGPKEEFF